MVVLWQLVFVNDPLEKFREKVKPEYHSFYYINDKNYDKPLMILVILSDSASMRPWLSLKDTIFEKSGPKRIKNKMSLIKLLHNVRVVSRLQLTVQIIQYITKHHTHAQYPK